MTYDLTAKFQDVIAEIAALKTEQQATNAKLDLLIAKDVTITGDVIADMTGIETRLDALKLALVGADSDPTDIRAAIWGLAGPAPGRTLADIHAALIGTDADPTDIRQAIWNLAGPAPGISLAQLYALWAPTGDDLRPYGHLSNIALDMLLMRQILADYKDSFGDRGAGMTLYNMLDAMHTNVSGILQDADAINTAIGGSPYQSLELTSVRGLLNALRQCACAKNDGPPLIGEDAVCASPYVSDGMHLFPWEFSPLGGTSVMIADFPDPPPGGLEFSGVTGNRSELSADDWSDWRVWVASEAAQFAMDYGLERYPTNQWVELSGSGTKAFSVDARYALGVTLCGASAPANCITLESEIVTANGFVFSAIVWPESWDAVTTHGVFVTGDKRWILLGDYKDWTYQAAGVEYIRDSSGANITTTDDGNGYRRIAVTTTSITFSLAGGNTGAFVLIFCQPEE